MARVHSPRRKYPPPAEASAEDVALSPDDEARLARLVKKYGRATIAAAANNVPLQRSRGRPPKGDLPKWEKAHEAEWIDEVAAEYRRAGVRNPVERAEFDLFEMTRDDKERARADAFERFQKTLRRKRWQARRDMREARLTARRREKKGRE